MSLNRRKNEDILNDLHSAQGRLNSSEIIDLKAELEINNMKKKIQKTNIEEQPENISKDQNTEINEFKKLLIENIQKNLFTMQDEPDKKNERKERFEDFLEFRKIKEEDYHIIAELYTYPNNIFIRSFHNTFYSEKEKSDQTILSMIEEHENNEKTKRFFELFLLFFEKYDWITSNHLNRIMEEKKEWKNWLHK